MVLKNIRDSIYKNVDNIFKNADEAFKLLEENSGGFLSVNNNFTYNGLNLQDTIKRYSPDISKSVSWTKILGQ